MAMLVLENIRKLVEDVREAQFLLCEDVDSALPAQKEKLYKCISNLLDSETFSNYKTLPEIKDLRYDLEVVCRKKTDA